MCIMVLFGWYTFHIYYMIVPPILTLLIALPLLISEKIKRHPALFRNILFLYNVCMVFFYSETITKYLAPNRLFCWQFPISLVLTYSVYLLFYAISGKTKFTIIISNIVFAAICISNRVLLDVRGRPLFISDFTSFKTALNVSGSYHISVIKYIVISLIFIMFTIFSLILINKQSDYKNNDKKPLSRVIASVFVIFVLLISYCTNLYKNLGIELTYWSHQNGILLDWIIESRDFKVKIPTDYTVENIQEIGKSYKPKENLEEYNGLKPNIICIMNESFCDPSVIGSFNTNIDYMPFLHSAMEGEYDDIIVGNAYSSVYGGNTANSEYEFLTNDSIILYPQNSVPYQTFLDSKGEISSIVTTLNKLGYHTSAMHPYWASGWNRPNIYKYMGFDKQYFLDDMTNIDYIRSYCSDSCNYRKIIELFENRDENVPFFMFNVTIQNHGGYTTASYPSTVQLTDYSGQFPQTQQYLSLVRESDKAIYELINYFRSVEEPTIIIFFGDHQPSIETGFYEKLYNKPFSSLTEEESLKMYITKYMIWKNFDTKTFEIGDTSINYLSALVMKMIGLPTTSYQNYLLDMREKYPIITANGVVDKEGVFVSVGEADLSFYKTIVYNHMLDNEEYEKEFFEGSLETNNDYLDESYANIN